MLVAHLAQAQTTEKSLTMANGDVRTYLLTLPIDGTVASAHPVVFDFHGAGSNALQQFAYSNLTHLADQDGDLVAMVNPCRRLR